MAYITDSWEEINAKCASGEYKTAYALGDLKKITLTWLYIKRKTIWKRTKSMTECVTC